MSIQGRLNRKIERMVNLILFSIFRFDRWHVANGFHSRRYKKLLVERINRIESRLGTVVEVGCGLGDILRNVVADRRIGCDLDRGVIRAARVRAWLRKIDYRVGDATVIGEDQIDVVVMVNWIHNLSEVELESMVNLFRGRSRFLVVDSIDESHLGAYRFSHKFEFLNRLGVLHEEFRCPGEPRTFQIWKLQ